MNRRTRIGTMASATLTATLCWSGGTAAAHAPTTVTGRAAVTCVGPSFSGTLGVNQAICNSGYSVTMQDNGDLVLRRSNGSACYASGTRAPGDATATFVFHAAAPPTVDINSASQGRIGRIVGAHNFTGLGTNASVNNRGEFYVGYKKIGYC
ncbi:hypothetical protein ACFY0F_38695 [Streptomyces sp. NPDC001544]|uniref:hypothetical protein n=1 Tax=Streptomyces sp. NPDC001544 TaxID=3364584 RepID=UPI0036980204